MKKIAKILAGLWIVGVIAIGIGGTWFQHYGDDLMVEAVTGMTADEIKELEERAETKRQEKREAAQFKDGGWGDETVPRQRQDEGWGD